MSTYLGTTLLAGVATDTISNGHSLLDFKWTDHILNELSWLRADTFSWQSGAVYVAAYNHLVADFSNGTHAQSETVGSYTIYYCLAPDGHKIVDTSQLEVIDLIYNESGVAWYYILDTANTRFKLPRTKKNKYTSGLGVKGNGKAMLLVDKMTTNQYSFHNGTGGVMYVRNPYTSAPTLPQAWAGNSTAPSQNYLLGVSEDENNSGLKTTDLPEDTQYLYFYVGQFSQSATEQTAGLNSELFNGKADIDLSNLTATGKEAAAGLGMPSGSYTDLTIGASSTNYTAPSNGYFCVGGYSNTGGGYVQITTANRVDFTFQGWGTQHWGRGFIPVKKGASIVLAYDAFTFEYFKFIPAEGDV